MLVCFFLVLKHKPEINIAFRKRRRSIRVCKPMQDILIALFVIAFSFLTLTFSNALKEDFNRRNEIQMWYFGDDM